MDGEVKIELAADDPTDVVMYEVYVTAAAH